MLIWTAKFSRKKAVAAVKSALNRRMTGPIHLKIPTSA